jgi:hypothetical protein
VAERSIRRIDMEMKFWKNNELDDAAIIKALNQAVKDYEDGAIAEVRDSLAEIVNAIDEFEAIMEGN